MIRAVALALAIVLPASAQDRPPTAPTRDVDVLYRANAGASPIEQRSRFAVSIGKVRIDTPSPGLYVIVDAEAKHMDMVSEGDRSVLELPYDSNRTAGGITPSGGFERLGADTVAGIACTEWRTADKAGRPMAVCMTADGVLLRARAGATVFVQAVRVVYGPIDPAVFVIPPSFQRTSARAAAR